MSDSASIESLRREIASLRGLVSRNRTPMTIPKTLLFVFLVNGVAIPVIERYETPYLYDGLKVINHWKREGVMSFGLWAGQYLYQRPATESVQTYNNVHPDLMKIYHYANKLAKQRGFQIRIREGIRTAKRQKWLVKKGASKTLNSRHLTGHALDLDIPYAGKRSDKKDWENARKINGVMQLAANHYFMTVEWGGNWKSFPDGFHFQLPWKSYPVKKHREVKQNMDARVMKAPTLTEDNFNRLITNIYESESSGDHRKEGNTGGHLGLCQFGAARLVDLGLIKRANFEKRHADFTGSNASTKEGRLAHKAFLANKQNWTIRGGKHAFLDSRKLQDKACRKAVKQNIATGVRLDIIKPGSSQKFIAGWGKAMQFGPERAIAWYTSRNDMTDGNGTKTSTFAAEGAAAVREH